MSRIDSISNFQYTHAKDDDLIVEDLYHDATSLSEKNIRSIKSIALKEPLLVNSLISPEGRVTGINITVQVPDKSPEFESLQARHKIKGLRFSNVGLFC